MHYITVHTHCSCLLGWWISYNVRTLGTAAWKRNSVIGVGVELVAVRVIAVTTGLLGLLSNEKTTFRPFFSYAVMLGIPAKEILIVHFE